MLEEAEPPGFLRWSYDGPVRGWGECEISALGEGALAAFTTGLYPEDPALSKLAGIAPARGAATSHLKRCLARLGQTVRRPAGSGLLAVSRQLSAASFSPVSGSRRRGQNPRRSAEGQSLREPHFGSLFLADR